MGSKGGTKIEQEAPDLTPLGYQYKNYDQQTQGVKGSFGKTNTDENIDENIVNITIPDSTREASRLLNDAYLECIRTSNFCQLAKDFRDESAENYNYALNVEEDLDDDLDKIYKELLQMAYQESMKYRRSIICASGTSRAGHIFDLISRNNEDLVKALMSQMGELRIKTKETEIQARINALDNEYRAKVQSFIDMASVPINLISAIKGGESTQDRDFDREVDETRYGLEGYYEHTQRSATFGTIPPDNGYLSSISSIINAVPLA